MKRALQGCIFLTVMLLAAGVGATEWKGLKIGVSAAEEARRLLGEPSSVYPDYYLFSKVRVKSELNPDTVQVNFDERMIIESLFIFPRWGLTNLDIEEIFKPGKRMTYGEFLQSSGITSYGAGTRAVEKLHYLPLSLPCEAYVEKRLLVVYEDRDLTSGEQLVKLIIYY